MSTKNLSVHVEFGGEKIDFEGNADEVFRALSYFLSRVYPNLQVLQEIVFSPDLSHLAEKLAGVVEILPEGPMIASGLDLSARNAICFALLGAYVGNRLGKLSKDSLVSNDLSKLTEKAKKTIANELPKLVGEGFIEKTSEAEYRITTLGIRKSEEIIEIYKIK